MAFAKKSGLMSDDQIERAQKMMKQEGPGGCRGMQCRDYCEDDAHAEECVAFAKKNGMMSPDERQTVQKFREVRGQKENCGTPEECRAKFEASGKELPPGQNGRDMKDDRRQERSLDNTQGRPPFDDSTSNVQRQRPTKEQEQQMRQEFDRQGAEEQNRGREMKPFINAGPGAAIISGFDLLTRLLGL